MVYQIGSLRQAAIGLNFFTQRREDAEIFRRATRTSASPCICVKKLYLKNFVFFAPDSYRDYKYITQRKHKQSLTRFFFCDFYGSKIHL